jgi:lipopolysaccharide/colanic/teichoic acid biosynthesis glycosyltransferase
MMKRAFDIVVAFVGLVALAPVFIVIALVIKLGDPGPVFFSQERIGLGGRPFRIRKFRTMKVNAEKSGPSITKAGDSRVTKLGVGLRKWKLDELPQLFNVLLGEMALVGPRPEVPRYVALYTPEQRRVLALRPGVTDLATLRFRNEEAMLAKAEDPEEFYRQYCIPKKIALNLEYAKRASLTSDIGLIFATLAAIFSGAD